MKQLAKISFIIIISILLSSCSAINQNFKYENFVSVVNTFNNNFKPVDFLKISPTDVLVKQILAFPQNLKLEHRTNDAVNGNTDYPSKYEICFLNKDSSILTKVNFIYAKSPESGIIFQSITSPVDNATLEKQYITLNRPFVIHKMLSMKDYLISLEYTLLAPEKLAGTDDEKIMLLIDADANFYKQLEEFLLNTQK